MNTPELVEIGDGAVLTVTWPDRSIQRLGAGRVRSACPCASCRGTFPVPEPDAVRIRDARLVGEYAVAFTFAPDGHSAGIFPFDLLAAMGKDR